jgi:hypothetical protein
MGLAVNQTIRSTSRFSRRKWPCLMTVMVMVAGMIFMFGYGPWVLHVNAWDTGNDLWGIFRGAHFIQWGYVGGVYTPGNGVVALPGMSLLLVPVAMLSSALHLSESYPPYILIHPTAALLIEPIELLSASTAIFACDALAEHLDVSSSRRKVLCVLVALLVWPVAAIWGHAEDALAMTFAIYALLAISRKRWAVSGWLLCAGILVQPLVALLLPLFIGATPSGKRMIFAVRSLALGLILGAVAFIGNPRGTYQSLVEQPTPPQLNHATPWVSFAPKIGFVGGGRFNVVRSVVRNGVSHFHTEPKVFHGQLLVAGGPGRMIDVVLAVLVGMWVWKRPQSLLGLTWLAVLVLSSRCFFEAVMTPYYLAPPLILALCVASTQRQWKFLTASFLAIGVSIFSYVHTTTWSWWLPVVAAVGAIVFLSFPGLRVPVIPEELPPPTTEDPTGSEPLSRGIPSMA